NDDRVRLVDVPAETVAVLRYSGIASPAAVATHTEELLTTLRDNGFEPKGEPFSWFYDPPWTVPFRRRNEVVVGVENTG
ncbi:MAG: heme-binding protein, partial [Mycobacterium sp.]